MASLRACRWAKKRVETTLKGHAEWLTCRDGSAYSSRGAGMWIASSGSNSPAARILEALLPSPANQAP